MKIEKVKIAELNPAEYNPRRMTNKQYEDLKNSLEKFGLVDPIIINADNTVVGGHQRLRIMRELGAELVPVVRVNLSKEDEKELNIRLNKNTGEFDLDVLANNFEIDELKDWGFKDVELGFNIDKIVEGNIEDDHIPEVKETRVKLGDVWQLGKHRLMCGDSTKESDVNKLMNGQKAELLHADPPYGMGKEKDGVLNDNLYKEKLDTFQLEWFKTFRPYLDDNGSCYIWGNAEDLWRLWYSLLKDLERLTYRNEIVWNKGHGMGMSSQQHRMYPTVTERCLFFMIGEQGFNNNQDNYFEKWEPIRTYLEKEIKKLNESDKTIATALGYKDGRTVNHWWSRSQWTFPTEKNYNALREYSKTKNNEGFKKEYE